MTDEIESGTPAPEDAPKPRKPRARKAAAGANTKQASAESRPATARTRKSPSPSGKTASAAEPAPKKKTAARRGTGTRKSAGKEPPEKAAGAPHPDVEYDFSGAEHLRAPAEDPIGDLSDGEAWAYTGEGLESEAQSEAEAYRDETAVDAVDGTLEAGEAAPADAGDSAIAAAPEQIAEAVAADRESEAGPKPQPPAKLERLQKILSQAGIASRRHAEEMITEGRVMVNGQVITALGSKADPERDHIRVDGKLLQGAERHRYFVLNKPKGYVTTVSDPEGRPTVMDLVRKLGERVYPVGRLDFQSEGLLLMTNDGALANQLTHASSGVEKIYLVKIAGQPDEEELERLRNGIMIERGGPASSGLYGAGGRVRTAPARIRQIRSGANPWYEVVLTEGRNRELRKMFSAVGHYVEKIRRVGYGPLVLDVEPGQVRELTLAEVDVLRQAAEGKLKPRRIRTEAMLPREAGRTAETRPAKPHGKHGHARDEEADFRRRPPQRFRDQERPRASEGFRAPERPRVSDRPRAPERPRAEDRFRTQDRPRNQDRPRTQARPEREFRGQRRDWQPRSREERPAWNKSGERPPAFGRRREEHGQRPERPGRNFSSRPPRGEGSRGPGRGFGRGPGARDESTRNEGRDRSRGFVARPARGESGGAPFRSRSEGSRGGRPQGRASGGAAAGGTAAGRPGRGFGAPGGRAGGARRGEEGGRRREFGASGRAAPGRTAPGGAAAGRAGRGKAGGARRGAAGGGRSGGFRPQDKRRGGGRGK